MTIRLFRRKSGTTRASTEDRAPEAQPTSTETPKRSSRRRRGGAKASASPAAPPPVTPQPNLEAAPVKTGRSRRGRRGGAGRRRPKSGAESEGATAAAAMPAVVPAKVQPLDGKRPTTLEELIDAQLTVMRGLQGAS